MVPTLELPPGIPFTCHVTAGFEAFCTGTTNWTFPPTESWAEEGDIVTLATGAGSAGVAAVVVFPPQATCCETAISASHLAMARACDRGERLRTRGEAGVLAGARTDFLAATIRTS